MLQAEIFLQYSMRSKRWNGWNASASFPTRGREDGEAAPRFYLNAGFMPKYDGSGASRAIPKPVASAPSAASGSFPAAASTSAPQAVDNEAAVDNFSRVTEITRNIYRQGNVKGVLFTAVNDVGRHWNASRCLAGLCNPGKPPSAALEYCATGIRQSEVMALVKRIMTLQSLSLNSGIVNVKRAQLTGTAVHCRTGRDHGHQVHPGGAVAGWRRASRHSDHGAMRRAAALSTPQIS